jgi:hypothetical protein
MISQVHLTHSSFELKLHDQWVLSAHVPPSIRCRHHIGTPLQQEAPLFHKSLRHLPAADIPGVRPRYQPKLSFTMVHGQVGRIAANRRVLVACDPQTVAYRLVLRLLVAEAGDGQQLVRSGELLARLARQVRENVADHVRHQLILINTILREGQD